MESGDKSREAEADNMAYHADPENPPEYTERSNVSGSGANPPDYNTSAEQAEPPPSYDSLYGRVKAAKAESDGTLGFFKTFIIIILSTVGFTILIALFMAVPVSMIVMGAIHLDDCKAERMIPIYLIVAGSFGCAKNLFSLIQRCRKTEEERQEDSKKVNPVSSIVDCFLFAWFIAGCVFIYRTKGDFQSHAPDASDYCDYDLYWFAFWITTSVYIIAGASCLCMCVGGCIAAVCVKS